MKDNSTRRKFIRTSGLLAVAPVFFNPLTRWLAQDSPEETGDLTTGLSRLRCEYQVNPLGIDMPKPRLSWELQAMDSKARGLKQSAYQVLVALSPVLLAEGKADLWNSGKVTSAASHLVPYAGKPLPPDTRCNWAVKVWNEADESSLLSQPAHFDTGLQTAEDWKGARWIAWRSDAAWREAWVQRKTKEFAAPKGQGDGFPYLTQSSMDIFELSRFHEPPYDPAPLFRKAFALDKPVSRARAYICGLGYYELYLNGKRVGDRLLDPAWTDYSCRVSYATYDVSDHMRPGGNAIGVMLGRGFYGLLANDAWNYHNSTWLGQPKLLFRISVEYVDGTRMDVVSGPDWKVTSGPVLYDCPRRGEIYDARCEIKDWNDTPFDDAAWDAATDAPAPAGALVSQFLPPIRATEEIRPVSVSNPKPGVYVFNLGRNIAGWPRLTLRGTAGTEILVRYSEKVPDEKFTLQSAWQQHGFILSGKGVNTLEPRFCYTGFQYVIVSVAGEPLPMTVDNLVGIHVHTDLESTGEFECSNPLINQIHRAVRLTLLNNAHGIPTDCPHREKMGWGADAMVASEAAWLNFDMAGFYSKYAADMWDTRTIPTHTPSADGKGAYAPAWGAAGLVLPWNQYLYYGDRKVLEDNYAAMKRYIPYLTNGRVNPAEPYVVREGHGDWVAPLDGQPTRNTKNLAQSKEGVNIYGTAYYYVTARTIEDIARVLGETQDAAQYASLAEAILETFNRVFYDPQTKCYRGEVREITEYRQSANAIPLAFGMVPEDRRVDVEQNLLNGITARADRLNTGILGTKAVMEVLPSIGAGELAYRLAAQTNFPSWGHMIRNGASTIWERWEGPNSLNHPAFGSVGAYFYRWLAGIQPDTGHPGFKHFIIRPTFVKDLTYVRAKYRSPYGVIESRWQRKDGTISLEVVVPPNTSALVRLPVTDPEKVTESGRPVSASRGVRLSERENGRVVYEVQSGKYEFKFSIESALGN